MTTTSLVELFEDEDETNPLHGEIRHEAIHLCARMLREKYPQVRGRDVFTDVPTAAFTAVYTQLQRKYAVLIRDEVLRRLSMAGSYLAISQRAASEMTHRARRVAILRLYDVFRGRSLPMPREYILYETQKAVDHHVFSFTLQWISLPQVRRETRFDLGVAFESEEEVREVAATLSPVNRELLRDKLAKLEKEGYTIDHAKDDAAFFAKNFSVAEQAQLQLDAKVAARFLQKKSHEITLDAYLSILNNLARARRPTHEERKNVEGFWSLFREARVFDVPAESILPLGRSSQAYAWKLVGLTQEEAVMLEPSESGAVYDERVVALAQIIAGMKFDFKLPFPVVYVGFGRGLTFSNVEHRALLGVLASTSGYVVLVIGNAIYPDSSRELFVLAGPGVLRADVPIDYLSTPWFLNALFDLLADQRTFQLTADRSKWFNQGYKAAGQREKKNKDRLPEPYYLVTLKRDYTLKEAEGDVARVPHPRAPLRFRFDVRATDRLLHRRGPLPMDPKLAKLLDRRRYAIYTGVLPAPVAAALQVRDISPPAEGEWLAVRIVPVKGHIRGPEDKPYVPSIRHVEPEV